MDEVRVWDVARTQAQIRSTMNDEVTGAPNLDRPLGPELRGAARRATNSGTAGANANLTLVASARLGRQAPTSATGPSPSTVRRQYVKTTPLATNTQTALRATNFTVETWFRRTGTGVGINTGSGTGTLASALPLISKGRADMEDPARDINYFLGIDTATSKIAADFEGLFNGTSSPEPCHHGYHHDREQHLVSRRRHLRWHDVPALPEWEPRSIRQLWPDRFRSNRRSPRHSERPSTAALRQRPRDSSLVSWTKLVSGTSRGPQRRSKHRWATRLTDRCRPPRSLGHERRNGHDIDCGLGGLEQRAPSRRVLPGCRPGSRARRTRPR